MDLQLKGKVALVTAASKGLGKAAAREFAREGAHVVMCARSKLIVTAAKEIKDETGGRVLAFQADVTKQADIDKVVEATFKEYGKIDILFVNAGGPAPGSFLSLKPEDWEAAANLTLMSAVRLCYAVVPYMLERGEGSILTTQSYSVKQPIDNLILSNSIRAAVHGMAKTLANQMAQHGITVNNVMPGYIHTDRIQQLAQQTTAQTGQSMEEYFANMAKPIPVGHIGQPQELGALVAFLASEQAAYINGVSIPVDGGRLKSTF